MKAFILELFKKRKDISNGNNINNPIIVITYTFLFLLVSIVLSNRVLGIAKDDYNYLNYFYFVNQIKTEDIWTLLLEEPLWRVFTSIVSVLFIPEDALKFMIFISSALFLFSVNKLNNRLVLFVLLSFLLHQYFATQMYFNQLRQGFALSLFLYVAIYCKRPFFGALMSVFIHTSFVFPLFIILLISKIESVKLLVLVSLLAVMFLYLSINILESLDLGRRTTSYSFEGKFTANYYIYTFIRYVPLLFLIQYYGINSKVSFWYKLALSSFLIIVPFTLIYAAGGRLVYYLNTFFFLMILDQQKSLGGKLAIIYYLLFLFIDLLIIENTVISDWMLILNI